MDKRLSFYAASSRKDKKGLVPIYAQVTILSKDYPVQVEKVKYRYWVKDKQRVKPQRQGEPYNRHKEINSKLDALSNDTSRFNRFLNYTTPPDRKEVKQVLENIRYTALNVESAFQEWLDEQKSKVSKYTYKNRNTVLNFLKRYQEHSNRMLQYDDFENVIFEQLYTFAVDVEEKENNTYATFIAKIKAFLNWSTEKVYFTGLKYKSYHFSEQSKDIICLTPDELKKLVSFKFESKTLDKVRDLYCFACFTGLRFEDLRTLRREHINNGTITKKISKTGEIDRIPLLPQAEAILKKYEGRYLPLPQITNQRANIYIKDACELAEINTPTIKYKYLGNQIEETTKPKHKCITFHTARKTFITVGFMKGLDTKIIKSITGHKKDSTFDKYLKIADKMKEDELKKAWGNL